jgi:hypothetical protein
MSDPAFIRLVRAAIAVLLGIAWAIAVILGVVFSFKGGVQPKWITSDGMTYFIPGLTALVGGVVATAFGIPTTDTDGPGPTDRLSNLVSGQPVSEAPDQAPPPENGDRKLKISARQWIGRGYIVIYLSLGALAALTWVIKGADTVMFVRTLAPAWGGLVLPIGASFFSET